MAQGRTLTPLVVIVGFGEAFLAFSGLETITQLAPAMREPRPRIASRAMVAVVVTMAITSPLLTLWSTTLLTGNPDETQFMSLLGAHVAGTVLAGYVAISGSLLLIFASNTAVIGAYHVFIALARMGFLPRVIEQRNRWRNTPHWAILLAVSFPIGLIALSGGSQGELGDLYAFGLLGAFILTCASLDVVRWIDGWARASARRRTLFWLGLVTTGLVITGWIVNLVAKPHATYFGGGLTVFGILVGLGTYHYLRGREPVVFPGAAPPRARGSDRRSRPAARVQRPGRSAHDPEAAEAVVAGAAKAAEGDRHLVFLSQGDRPAERRQELMEVVDPYLRDRAAQVAFAPRRGKNPQGHSAPALRVHSR